MNIWGSKTLRRLAVPLAVVSFGAALTAGWGQSLASSAPTVDPNVPDPEVNNQSIILVLAPKGDDNFQPNNACGGAPGTLTTPTTGTFSAGSKLTLSQNRCTLAIFVPNQKPNDYSYSSTPCPVDNFPNATVAPTSIGLQALSLKSADQIKSCTAPAFLASVDTNAGFLGAAGVEAIHDFPGAGCKPSQCRLFMMLTPQDGDFNAPGLCSAAFYLTGPCTAAVIGTSHVAGAPGGAHLSLSDNKCPTESNLSLPPIGDISDSCTNLPFKPADMSITLPPGMTANPELQSPVAALPQHSTEVADQAISYELSPAGQLTFDPMNACSIDGIKPVNRCTAAIINLPTTTVAGVTTGFPGGDVKFPTSRCTLDTSTSNGKHGNNQSDPCFAQPFSPSKGETAIHNLPAITCHAAEPAVTTPSSTVEAVVPCRIYVILTRDDGDGNLNNPCTTLSNGTTSINTACLLFSVKTTEQHEGDHVTVMSTTPVCPSGGAAVVTPVTNQPGVDADVHDTCVAGGAVVPPAAPVALTFGAVIATTGPVTILIPSDPVLGSNE